MSATCLRSNIFVVIALLSSALTARADIISYGSVGAFNSALPSAYNTENVLFNSGGPLSGLTVTGLTNQTNTPVDISSTTSLTASGGQALAIQVNAENGGTFSNATIKFQDPFARIQAIIFNLDNGQGTSESKTSVKFTANDENGTSVFSYIVDQGNNFFGVIAFDGSSIASVNVQVMSDSAGTSLNVLQQLYQIRIAGGSGATTNEPPPPPGVGAFAVPEPAAWLVWTLLGAGPSAFAFRKRPLAKPAMV